MPTKIFSLFVKNKIIYMLKNIFLYKCVFMVLKHITHIKYVYWYNLRKNIRQYIRDNIIS